MKDGGLGNLFVRHLVMAVPWAIVFLLVFFITTVGIKQQIKEGIQYAVRMAISETSNFAYNYNVGPALKQNMKKGVEFVGKTATREVKTLLSDPEVKEDLQETFRSGE
jgi:hypothetical protein